jgi:succinate dehydrogenase/fumarate reductase flavoprotein subunit
MEIELIPLCTIDATLAAPIVVGNGAAGMRVIFDVADATVCAVACKDRAPTGCCCTAMPGLSTYVSRSRRTTAP